MHAQELIKPLLFAGEARAAALDAYIVERISAAIAVLKACRTKEQTNEYLMALALVMPSKEAKRLDAISKRVGFSYCQSSKRGGRKRAADHQMERRADFDKAAALLEQPLQVGEEVLAGRGPGRARGELTLLETADGKGRCAVMFRAGSEEVRVEYAHSFGKIDNPPRRHRGDRRAGRLVWRAAAVRRRVLRQGERRTRDGGRAEHLLGHRVRPPDEARRHRHRQHRARAASSPQEEDDGDDRRHRREASRRR